MTSSNAKSAPPADVSAQVRQAQAAARDGHALEAERIYRDILSDHPGSQAATLGLIKILEQRGDREEAIRLLRRFTNAAPGHANVLAAASLWHSWQDSPLPEARTIRIALTGTGTLAPLGAHLRVACAQIGLHPALYVSDFNQWVQDLLSPESPLYAANPELIVLLLDAADVFPIASSENEADQINVLRDHDAGIGQIREVLAAVSRNAPSATVLIHTFAVPDRSPLGILDVKEEFGQRARYAALNAALITLVNQEFPRTALFDQERVEARHGKAHVRDERMWYMASMPFSEGFLPDMASEYLRTIRPLKGLVRKCIAVDLDNTLWGGVIGEDGVNQIKIGGTAAPGNAFRDFQKALDALRRRGVLLAVCSKNNPDDVWPVFESHPDMVLKREHFAAVRVNWKDKATNLKEIAGELNIGLDSLVFLDDNPVERGLVRQELPQVLTVELPRDPAFYTRTLNALDVFETLAITDEDRRRNELYLEQQARKSFEEAANAGHGNIMAYLAGLRMVVTIAPLTPFTLPRAVQLINKTNQFNTTTRRLTEAEVQALESDAAHWGIFTVNVADRFGDSGLTGVAIVEKGVGEWLIDAFLLSCRVLGRGVEDALVAHICRQARAAGAERLRAAFIPTTKNEPASGFYERMGFTRLSGTAGHLTEIWWELPLTGKDNEREFPEWLTVCVKEGNADD